MKILLVIPAYNEESSICKLINNILANYPEYDYVIVNDGSQDCTSKICHENHFNVIDHSINLKLAGAFQTGMQYAYKNDYDYAIQIDADGQHDIKYIKGMLQEMAKGNDIIIGSRFLKEKKVLSLRTLGNTLISLAIQLTTGYKITDPTSGMRLYNRSMIKQLSNNINYGPEPDTISYLMKNGAQVSEVQVHMHERETGASYLTFSKSIYYMTQMLISILLIQSFRRTSAKNISSEKQIVREQAK